MRGFCYVSRLAEHPIRFSSRIVVELSVSCNPSHSFVESNYTEFGNIGFSILLGVSERFRNKIAVVRMDAAAKVGHRSYESVRRHAEHGLEVAEPAIAPSLDIQIPAHGLARFHGQAQSVICNCQFGLSLFCPGALEEQA